MKRPSLECTLTTCHCFSVSFPCAYACVVPVYTYDAMKQAQAQAQAQENGNRSILLCLCLCLCLRPCVVRVNWDDASISTRESTRSLCLRRTGLHVGFLCLCLCLRHMCKPGLIFKTLPMNSFITIGLKEVNLEKQKYESVSLINYERRGK